MSPHFLFSLLPGHQADHVSAHTRVSPRHRVTYLRATRHLHVRFCLTLLHLTSTLTLLEVFSECWVAPVLLLAIRREKVHSFQNLRLLNFVLLSQQELTLRFCLA